MLARRGVIDPSELEALSETTDIVNAPVCWGDNTGGGTPVTAEVPAAESGIDKLRGYCDGRREGKRRDILFRIKRGVGAFLVL